MKSLFRLRKISFAELVILAEGVFLLTAVSVCLRLRGLLRTRWWLRQFQVLLVYLPQVTAERVVALVTCADKHCPLRSTCLTRALAAHLLLARSGHESRLHIGVARDERGAFEAHAWLERNQQVILGGTREYVNRYVALDRADELTV